MQQYQARTGGFLGLVLGLLFLAGCVGTGPSTTPAPTTPIASQPVTGEVLGTGPVRVALLVPLSANGNAAEIAQNLRNAASLAIQEMAAASIQVLVKDTAGTPEGARAAATEAIAQGAELILGPLLAAEVTAVSSVARPQGIPVIAFSSDVSVASSGVYLLNFLPRADVERIISYAALQGNTAIAALLPNDAYGTVVEVALRETVALYGARVVAIERYALDRTDMQAKAEAIATIVNAGQADAVFMPDAGDTVPFLAQILAARGVTSREVQFLGSGRWIDDRIQQEPTLARGWYPGAEEAAFDAFAGRYAVAFGATPNRIASLGYDAVTLAAGLAAQFGTARFQAATITSASGYRGMDGVFRLLTTGANQRALAVYQVNTNGVPSVQDPAPPSFAPVATTVASVPVIR